MRMGRLTVRASGVLMMVTALVGVADVGRANEPGADARTRAEGRLIEGVWLPIVTITDCQSEAVVATFPSMEIYVRGGGYVGFGAVQKSDQVGMGAWRHLRGRRFTVEYQFLSYAPAPVGAPDGPPDGNLLRVSSTIQLDETGTRFTSREVASLIDPSGNVLLQTCGHRQAARLQ